jgi:hypothetical protein
MSMGDLSTFYSLPQSLSKDPILKKPITKKGWWSGSRCGLNSNPSPHQKKKKEREKEIKTVLQFKHAYIF